MKEIHLNRLAREKEIEWAYVYRKSAIERVGGWNENLVVGEDRDIAKRLVRTGSKLHLIQERDNIHYLSGIYDGITPILRKQFKSGKRHSSQGTIGLGAGWMVSGLTVLGICLVVMSTLVPVLLGLGLLLIAVEYILRLTRLLKESKGAWKRYIPLLPFLAVAMNISYGLGRIAGYFGRNPKNRKTKPDGERTR